MKSILFEQFVKLAMDGVHFRPLRCVDYNGRSLGSLMRTLCGSSQPIIVFGRHENELASAMACYFDRFTLRFMLILTELALKFQCGCPCHRKTPSLNKPALYV